MFERPGRKHIEPSATSTICQGRKLWSQIVFSIDIHDYELWIKFCSGGLQLWIGMHTHVKKMIYSVKINRVRAIISNELWHSIGVTSRAFNVNNETMMEEPLDMLSYTWFRLPAGPVINHNFAGLYILWIAHLLFFCFHIGVNINHGLLFTVFIIVITVRVKCNS